MLRKLRVTCDTTFRQFPAYTLQHFESYIVDVDRLSLLSSSLKQASNTVEHVIGTSALSY